MQARALIEENVRRSGVSKSSTDSSPLFDPRESTTLYPIPNGPKLWRAGDVHRTDLQSERLQRNVGCCSAACGCLHTSLDARRKA